MRYYLSLGSNLGQRRRNLRLALDELAEIGRWITYSAVYETEPVGFADQPPFLNMLGLFDTDLRPFRLLRKIKSVETHLGRRHTRRYGPRPIDIDIIEYEGEVIRSGLLNIPHLEWQKRNFVLHPFKEIKADFVTREGRPLKRLLEQCEDRSWVKLVSERL